MRRRGDDIDPVICAVCSRAAGANGWNSGKRNAPTLWRCDNSDCGDLIEKVYRMSVRQLSALEAYSLADAGAEAGAYLEKIEKTDLGEMNAEEWNGFLKTILHGYENAMRERLGRNGAQ